jgi:formate hydrogenlyase subunit 3/multisubunit Na+/H+ antiporter MnhD subunit
VFEGMFRVDALALTVGGFAFFFFLLILTYSPGYLGGRKGKGRFYIYLVATILVTEATVLADNVLVFLVGWGFLGLLLYLLIGVGDDNRAAGTAKKALVIVGATDVFMILGFVILVDWSGGAATATLSSLHVEAVEPVLIVAFLCLLSAALAKAGAMPVHSWVPDCAQDAWIPVTAYLPASLDKLLGIYFLARLTLEIFQFASWMGWLLMAVGSGTIVAAVMMALVQHDLKRLLGYHAVSQVGYMVLGLGTGTAVGIAGGLFHMINHALYKSGLFLCGGNVEKVTGTSDLDNLGGLGRRMPLTFTAFLISALAISGIPPLNGFASKWLVYQGIIESGRSGGYWWLVWLIAAMFGTALTLASFAKLLHAVFLGQESPDRVSAPRRQEVAPSLWVPPLLVAALCLLFGVLAMQVPLKWFVFPALAQPVIPAGVWESGPAALLLVMGLFLGLLFLLVGARGKIRVVEPFIGGEVLDEHPEMRVSGVRFYRLIHEMKGLAPVYALAEKGWFDLYEVGRKSMLALGRVLGDWHNGLLPRYLSWCLVGLLLIVLFLKW